MRRPDAEDEVKTIFKTKVVKQSIPKGCFILEFMFLNKEDRPGPKGRGRSNERQSREQVAASAGTDATDP